MGVKEQFKRTEKLYHFTSFDTALKIIETNRLRFGRLNNMNDIHENDKITFVDANDRPFDIFPSDMLNTLHDEIYKYRQISLTADNEEGDKDGFDLHQMWGLYADKGEGVCLVFDKKELEKNYDNNIHWERVNYDKSYELDSFIVSNLQKPEEIIIGIKNHITDIFFHKRVEWEHEQEYRLIKRCPIATKEEYLLLGNALKYIILSSKFQNFDEVLYFKRIKDIKGIIEKMGKTKIIGGTRYAYANGFPLVR